MNVCCQFGLRQYIKGRSFLDNDIVSLPPMTETCAGLCKPDVMLVNVPHSFLQATCLID